MVACCMHLILNVSKKRDAVERASRSIIESTTVGGKIYRRQYFCVRVYIRKRQGVKNREKREIEKFDENETRQRR